MITTIPEGFFGAAGRFPESAAFHVLRGSWRTISYREFSASVSAIAFYLLNTGLRKGDRVGILSENRPEWCAAYLGIVTAGGIAVPVDAQLGSDDVCTLFLDADVRVAFHSAKTEPQLQGFRAHPGAGAAVLVSFDAANFSDMLRPQAERTLPVAEQDDIASIIYTSGTTGRPKGVMLTHRNFCSDAEALIAAQIVSHEDNVLSILPLHHTYAFMCTFLLPLLLGASVTYPASLKGPDMLAAVRDRGVTLLIGVPQVLGLLRNSIMNRLRSQPQPMASIAIALHKTAGFFRKRLGFNIGKLVFRAAHRAFGPQFRFLGSGGAKLDPQIMDDLEALGFTVLEGYGLTETAPVVTFNPPDRRRRGSAGKPLPSVEIRISEPAASGEGEIEIRGPMLMKGYYRNPEATATVIRDGWFRTGDLGRMDREAYLYITGRSKEVIVLSSGKNIYPEEVEKRYAASPLISELCVTGVGKNGIIKTLHGVIVPDFDYARQAGIGNVQEGLKWEINQISSTLPPPMRITSYSIRKEPLPRTPLGKLRRFMITEGKAEAPKEKPAPAAEDADARTETGRQVIAVLRRFVKDRPELSPDDHLELDLGLDSLLKIELTASLEKSFDTRFPEDFLADAQTVRDLIKKTAQSTTGGGAIEQAVSNGWKKLLTAAPSGDFSLTGPRDSMLPSRILHSLLRFLFLVFFRLEARGLENLPREGSYILASNHASYLDGFVVVLALPFSSFRKIYSLGLSEYFTGRIKGWFARIGHVIPIDATAYLNRALQASAHVLSNGFSLSVFPEGGRSFDNTLLEFKKGVGILAVEMRMPVVPVYINGAYDALPRTAVLPRPKKITITFGKPIRADAIDFSRKPDGTDRYQHFANMLRDEVAHLRDAVK